MSAHAAGRSYLPDPEYLTRAHPAGTRGTRSRAAEGGPPRPAPRVGPVRHPSRPHRDPRAPVRRADLRADPHPLRTDGGLPVRLLPRRRGDHGRGPRRDARVRSHRPTLRRRAPDELRTLRDARALPDLRPERLRRNAAGPDRMGRGAIWRPASRSRDGISRSASPSARRRCWRRSAPIGRRCSGSPSNAISRSGTSGSRPRSSVLGSASTRTRDPRRRSRRVFARRSIATISAPSIG